MNTQELFRTQLQAGATEKFFYAIETTVDQNIFIVIKVHKSSLGTFPKNLIYIRDIGTKNHIPLFKEN